MGSADAQVQLPTHVDNSIASMIYSMIGEPSVEARLHYELDLAQKSLLDMHAQLKALQLKCQLLEEKHAKSREEASLNAAALRQKIGDLDALKRSHEQLLRECELYRNDREIFAEAAEDAEERRAEADRKADEAEERAIEAERREKAAIHYIENVLKGSMPSRKAQISQPMDKKDRQTTESLDASNLSREDGHKEAQNLGHSLLSPADKMKSLTSAEVNSIESTGSHSPLINLLKEARGAKRILFDAAKGHERKSPLTKRRIGKSVSVDRAKLLGENSKIARVHAPSLDEKENTFMEANIAAQLEQAAFSENAAVRYLAERLKILKANLVKAEAEGDIIHAKYCEVHKLLMDTLATFGVLPELCDGKVAHTGSASEE